MRIRPTRSLLLALSGTAAVLAPVTAQAALRSPAAVVTAPVNLLTGDSASFAAGPGSWTAQNGSLSVPFAGMLATTTAASGWSLAQSGPLPAAPDQVFTGVFSARAASTARSVVPYLYFLDASGTVLDKVKGEAGQDAVGSWTPMTAVVGLAPAGTAAVELASLTWGSLAGETHAVTAPSLTVGTPARTAVAGPLHTSGNQVFDAHGPIVLRGIHRVGLEGSMGSDRGVNLTPADLGQAKRWGATMVRLPVSPAYWLSSNCHYDAGYAAAVDQAVAAVTGAGMVALVDQHTNSTTACGTVAPQPMADSSAVAFWSAVARRYRSNPLVAFDLYNEPHDISASVWLRGGTVSVGGTSYQAVGMQQMYNAVRSAGAQNLTFISGNSWANTPPPALVSGYNIVYGVHAYTCPNAAVDASCAANPTDPSSILGAWVTPSQQVPVVITEFGWPSTSTGLYVSNVISYARAHNWGWISFAWDGTVNGTFSLLATAGPGASYQPTPLGMPVLSALSGS